MCQHLRPSLGWAAQGSTSGEADRPWGIAAFFKRFFFRSRGNLLCAQRRSDNGNNSPLSDQIEHPLPRVLLRFRRQITETATLPQRGSSSRLIPTAVFATTWRVRDEFAGWMRPSRASRNIRSKPADQKMPNRRQPPNAWSTTRREPSTARYFVTKIFIGHFAPSSTALDQSSATASKCGPIDSSSITISAIVCCTSAWYAIERRKPHRLLAHRGNALIERRVEPGRNKHYTKPSKAHAKIDSTNRSIPPPPPAQRELRIGRERTCSRGPCRRCVSRAYLARPTLPRSGTRRCPAAETHEPPLAGSDR